VKRPLRGRRSHVIADSEQVDSWRFNGVLWRKGTEHILENVERARELRIEVQRARTDLHQKMAALREQLALLHRRRRKRPSA
jgi:hypothetical protein